MKIISYPNRIRFAVKEDIEGILKIAHQYPKELGFVRRASLEDSLIRGSLLVADYENVLVGFVNYRARKDGWNVIYEIATHRDFLKKGIGSFLLHAVPFPIKLKCPIDNESNKFYAHEGMTLLGVEQGRKRKLNVWIKNRIIVLCKGSSKSVIPAVNQTSMLYGTRHTERPLVQPFMVDIKWDKYDWEDYKTKLKAWKPVLALAPDFLSIEQLPDLLSKIRELRDIGILKIAVCPKFKGAVQYIPKDCIVAVSLITKYAGYEPPVEELVGRKIHLLGGSPQQQFRYIQNVPGVISADINMHTYSASKGSLYDGESNKWKYNIKTKKYTYQERILISSQNIEGRLL